MADQTPDAEAPDTARSAPPSQIRNACLVVLLEALALLGAAGILLFKTVTGHPDEVGRALLGAALALAGAATLALGARGLYRLNPPARTPVIVLQILAIPVAYSLAFQAKRVEYGGPILLAVGAVLYLLFTPQARLALDREPQ